MPPPSVQGRFPANLNDVIRRDDGRGGGWATKSERRPPVGLRMKRKSDNLADSFATDESDGWLARFLADEEDLDNRAKWRLATWGAGSLGAIVIAILAGQAAGDRTREQVAAADLARQSQAIQQLAKESRGEAGRLAAAIETLNGDRDRLYAKLGSLEQGLDSVTGSIARTRPSAQLPSIPVDKPNEKTSDKRTDRIAPESADLGPTESRGAEPRSSDIRPAKLAEARPETKTAEVNSAAALATATKPITAVPALPEPPAARPVATTVIPAAAVAPPVPTPPQEAAEPRKQPERGAAAPQPAPLIQSKSILAPPDVGAGRLEPAANTPQAVSIAVAPAAPAPTPPVNVAAAVPPVANVASTSQDDGDDDAPAEAAAVPVPRTEFGVDLGSAGSVEGLRTLWLKLAKTHKELKPLRPVIMVKDQGRGAQLRLVAGPLGDAAAAAKLCATLGGADRACETSIFDGQRLPVAAVAPLRPRKRTPKVTSVPEPPPPPPAPAPAPQAQAQPASFTSFLGLRPQPPQ